MKYHIHWNHAGYEDYLVIEADSEEEIRAIALQELDARRVPQENAWSKKVED